MPSRTSDHFHSIVSMPGKSFKNLWAFAFVNRHPKDADGVLVELMADRHG